MDALVSRRRLLRATGAVASTALAGCASQLGMHEDEPPLRHLDPAGKHVEWAVKLNAPAGRPATVGDAVYVGNSWNVYALDAADGSERWRHDLYTPSDVVCYRGELAVADGRVYAPTCENTVALYADDADLAWRASRESNGPPRIADDSVVVAGRELAALDAATGSTEWHSTFEEGFRVPPAVGSDVAVGVTQENRLVACDVADGRVRWETGVAASLPPPGVGSGTVVVEWGSADNVGFLQAYDAATGEQVWSRDTGVEGRGTRPVVADGVVYVVRSDDHLYAHDAADGEQLWSYRVGGRFHDPPMVESGRAYVGGGSGTVHVVDAATGDRLRRLDTGFDDVPTPSVDDDGTVYAAVGDRVVALDAG